MHLRTTTTRAGLTSSTALLFIHLLSPTAWAQNCYYPNGDISSTDAPCNTDGGPCCPLNWECMSNGLCYYEPADYWGRYTCTDQAWGAVCPDYCTHNLTASGNEAIQRCNSDDWCCDANRPAVSCCSKKNAELIRPGSGRPVQSISELDSTPDRSSTSISTTKPTSSTDRVTDEATTPLSSSTTEFSTSYRYTTPTTTTSSDSTAGIINITPTTPTTQPSTTTAPPPPQNAPTASPNTLSIGLGVGIPTVLLAAAAAIALILYRRHQKQRAKHQHPPTSDRTSPDRSDLSDMYAHSKSANEIDSRPIADPRDDDDNDNNNNNRRPSPSPRYCCSELSASPAISSVSAPSRDSLVHARSLDSAATAARFSSAPRSPALQKVPEQPEPQELAADRALDQRSFFMPAALRVVNASPSPASPVSLASVPVPVSVSVPAPATDEMSQVPDRVSGNTPFRPFTWQPLHPLGVDDAAAAVAGTDHARSTSV